MQKERDTLIEREVAQLNAALGPMRAARLQAVIENDFAPNVRIQNIQPMGPRDLSKKPLPKFPPEVR
jgi:hypothetical protein